MSGIQLIEQIGRLPPAGQEPVLRILLLQDRIEVAKTSSNETDSRNIAILQAQLDTFKLNANALSTAEALRKSIPVPNDLNTLKDEIGILSTALHTTAKTNTENNKSKDLLAAIESASAIMESENRLINELKQASPDQGQRNNIVNQMLTNALATEAEILAQRNSSDPTLQQDALAKRKSADQIAATAGVGDLSKSINWALSNNPTELHNQIKILDTFKRQGVPEQPYDIEAFQLFIASAAKNIEQDVPHTTLSIIKEAMAASSQELQSIVAYKMLSREQKTLTENGTNIQREIDDDATLAARINYLQEQHHLQKIETESVIGAIDPARLSSPGSAIEIQKIVKENAHSPETLLERINYLEKKDALNQQTHQLGLLTKLVSGPPEKTLDTSGKYTANPQYATDAKNSFNWVMSDSQNTEIGRVISANEENTKSPEALAKINPNFLHTLMRTYVREFAEMSNKQDERQNAFNDHAIQNGQQPNNDQQKNQALVNYFAKKDIVDEFAERIEKVTAEGASVDTWKSSATTPIERPNNDVASLWKDIPEPYHSQIRDAAIQYATSAPNIQDVISNNG